MIEELVQTITQVNNTNGTLVWVYAVNPKLQDRAICSCYHKGREYITLTFLIQEVEGGFVAKAIKSLYGKDIACVGFAGDIHSFLQSMIGFLQLAFGGLV